MGAGSCQPDGFWCFSLCAGVNKVFDNPDPARHHPNAHPVSSLIYRCISIKTLLIAFTRPTSSNTLSYAASKTVLNLSKEPVDYSSEDSILSCVPAITNEMSPPPRGNMLAGHSDRHLLLSDCSARRPLKGFDTTFHSTRLIKHSLKLLRPSRENDRRHASAHHEDK